MIRVTIEKIGNGRFVLRRVGDRIIETLPFTSPIKAREWVEDYNAAKAAAGKSATYKIVEAC